MGKSRRTLKGDRGYYELLVPLARRDLSEYHLAVNRQIQGPNPWVVVRESLPHVAEDKALTQAFLAELRVTTQFNHPNLVRTLETGILGKRYFVIAEYLFAEGLGAVVQAAANTGKAMTPAQAAGLMAQACAGLEAAHQTVDAQGTRLAPLHRNLTPACLLIGYDGLVKVIGFEPEGKTPPGPSESARRDVSYYSPELCQGKPLDLRSDVFSLGVILWELLAQKPLFRRVSQQGTLQAILEAKIPPLDASSDRGVHPELETLVLRSLDREPDKRFQSAAEMGAALTAWAAKAGQVAGDAELAAMMTAVLGDRLERKQKLLDLAQKSDVSEKDIPLIRPDTDVGLAWPSETKVPAQPTASAPAQPAPSAPAQPETNAPAPSATKVEAKADLVAERLGSGAEGVRLNTTTSGSFNLPKAETAGMLFDPEEEAAKAQRDLAPKADDGSVPPVVGTLETAPPASPKRRPAWILPVVGLVAVALIGVGLVFAWPILFEQAQQPGDGPGPATPAVADAGPQEADGAQQVGLAPLDGGPASDAEDAPDAGGLAAAEGDPAEPAPPMPTQDEAWVTIQSTPVDCGVRMNKKRVKGKTPIADYKVEPGAELEITVFCRRHRYQNVRVTPRPGERLTLAFNPEPR